MDNERRYAYLVLMDVEERQAFSNLALNHRLVDAKAQTKGATRNLVYGVLENKLYLDYIINHYLKDKRRKLAPVEKTLLRMGIYQLAFMKDIPSYAVVSETVNLARKYKRGMEGFVNAILRNYLRTGENIRLPDRKKDESLYLSIKYSYAKWIVDMWLKEYGSESTEELLKAGNEIPKLNIRPNLLKTDEGKLQEELEARAFKVSKGQVSKRALKVEGEELLSSDLYGEGMFSVQDEASMVAVEIMGPKEGEFIVDTCSAPGGKTMYTAESMGNLGRVSARDIYKKRLQLVENEASRLGIDIVQTKLWDATELDGQIEGMADRVLVDAPCSGLGTVRHKPEIKYKRKEDVETLPKLQKQILFTSSKYVKKEGVLLYSTCTINPDENGDVVKAFLNSNDDFVKLEEVQLLPSTNDTDGFYICKMKRR